MRAEKWRRVMREEIKQTGERVRLRKLYLPDMLRAQSRDEDLLDVMLLDLARAELQRRPRKRVPQIPNPFLQPSYTRKEF